MHSVRAEVGGYEVIMCLRKVEEGDLWEVSYIRGFMEVTTTQENCQQNKGMYSAQVALREVIAQQLHFF